MPNRPGLALLIASLAPFVLALVAKPAPPQWKLIIGGSTKGYLSPCGCTEPMSGGIRRRATVVKRMSEPGDLVVETGPFAGAPGRQMEIKAETLAQALKAMGVDVVALRQEDLAVGPGVLEAVGRLSGAELLNGGPDSMASLERCLVASDPGGINVAEAISRAKNAVVQADTGQAVVYVTGLDKEGARAIAQAAPQLDVVVYASTSHPKGQAELVGNTWLVTASDQGRYVVSLTFTGERFEAPSVTDLGPDVADDPDVARYYRQYLDRLRDEHLVELMPKPSTDAYSGSKACKNCHTREFEVWEKSGHAHAWPTLKRDGHDADPDCVPCHTTGITSTGGFIVEEKTPQLAEVGCESCHESGAAHITMPESNPLPKVGELACAPCHKLQNSPNFRFDLYWKKIEH